MKVMVIGAMREEIELIVAGLQSSTLQRVGAFQYHRGKLHHHEVVVLEPGIGKVNAALGVAEAVRHFQPDLLVNTGSAGGVGKGVRVGDIVIADQVAYHDVDNRIWAYEYGQVPRMPARYEVEADWLEHARLVGHSLAEVDHHIGLITSGDSFIAAAEQKHTLLQHFPDVCAVDMESGAIAQACYVLQQPYLIIRAISDAGDASARQDHEANLQLSCQRSAQFVLALLAWLK